METSFLPRGRGCADPRFAQVGAVIVSRFYTKYRVQYIHIQSDSELSNKLIYQLWKPSKNHPKKKYTHKSPAVRCHYSWPLLSRGKEKAGGVEQKFYIMSLPSPCQRTPAIIAPKIMLKTACAVVGRGLVSPAALVFGAPTVTFVFAKPAPQYSLTLWADGK